MFPAEILARIGNYCNLRTLTQCRQVCRLWFYTADEALDRFRGTYALSETNYSTVTFGFLIKYHATVRALNTGEAVTAFILHVDDPIWQSHIRWLCSDTLRLKSRRTRQLIRQNTACPYTLTFAQEWWPCRPWELSRKLDTMCRGEGLFIYPCAFEPIAKKVLPRGSWRNDLLN